MASAIRLTVIAALGVMLPLAGGCASDNRPEYVTPTNLSADQAVTVKGIKGVYINAVDGAKVKNSGVVVLGVIGGNTVTITPGEHAMECNINTSNWHSTVKFNLAFDAGTTYEIGPNSVWFPKDVEIKNTKTGATVEPQ